MWTRVHVMASGVIETGLSVLKSDKRDEAGLILVQDVVDRLNRSKNKTYEDVEIGLKETRAIYRLLYKRHNKQRSETLDRIIAWWTSMDSDMKRIQLEELLSVFSANTLKAATMVVTILSVVVVYIALVVGVFVSPVNPFTRVATLTAKCA